MAAAARIPRILGIEWQSLYKTPILAEFAMQRYKSTPLGQIMANIIDLHVTQRRLRMQIFLAKIDDMLQALWSISIRSLWPNFIWPANLR